MTKRFPTFDLDTFPLYTKVRTHPYGFARGLYELIKVAISEIDNVKAGVVAEGSISEAELANQAVTESKLATGAVTSGKLGAGAVGTAKVADDAITGAKLNFKAVAITVAAAATTGSSAADPDLVGGIIMGFLPTGNMDQFPDEMEVGVDGAVTVTLANAATADNTYTVNVFLP